MILEWHVCFGEAESGSPWWIRAITRPGYRHVFAFGFDRDAGAWVMFWPTWSRVEVHVCDAAWVDAWIAAGMAGAIRILRVSVDDAGPVRPRLLVTCAGAISGLLGLAVCSWRPEDLWRRLLARGAVRVFAPAREVDAHGGAVQPAEASTRRRPRGAAGGGDAQGG